MGLTVHYTLRSSVKTAREAQALVRELHRRARLLPFDKLSPIAAYSAGDITADEPPGWLGFALEMAERKKHGMMIRPDRAVGFIVYPAEGSETATFGLMRYPRSVELADGRRVTTGRRGWRWTSFCKTQYASDPRLGGWENFRRCHVALIELLDAAEELGFHAKVYDESNYYDNRDLDALAREIGRWNEFVAGMVGKLKDAMPGACEAPITQYPNFEHLEAKGRDVIEGGQED